MNQFDPQIHHRHSIRLQGYDYTQAGAYFVTIAAQGRACLFGEVRDGEMRLSAVGKIVQWEWMRLEEQFPPVELGACVVMPNHIHGIIVIHAAERAPRHVHRRTARQTERRTECRGYPGGSNREKFWPRNPIQHGHFWHGRVAPAWVNQYAGYGNPRRGW